MVANMDDEEQWEDVKSRKKRVEITNGFEEDPDFSDPDDYVDDISDSGAVYRPNIQLFNH